MPGVVCYLAAHKMWIVVYQLTWADYFVFQMIPLTLPSPLTRESHPSSYSLVVLTFLFSLPHSTHAGDLYTTSPPVLENRRLLSFFFLFSFGLVWFSQSCFFFFFFNLAVVDNGDNGERVVTEFLFSSIFGEFQLTFHMSF